MHYEDLTLCHYHSGGYDPANWAVPLLAVGWLEHPYPFTAGDVPYVFVDRLKLLIEISGYAYSHINFRGLQSCSLCAPAPMTSPVLQGSDRNIFVPGNLTVYVAPAGIIHYIESHGYLPPAEFIEAVMHCPACGTHEYQDTLRTSNAGNPPPLITAAEESLNTYNKLKAAEMIGSLKPKNPKYSK